MFVPIRPVDSVWSERRPAILSNTCSKCGCVVTGFTDAVSEREYALSGFCQSCQDEFFGG